MGKEQEAEGLAELSPDDREQRLRRSETEMLRVSRLEADLQVSLSLSLSLSLPLSLSLYI